MFENMAFLFPGQGSQYVGMGKDLWERFSSAKEIFEQIDDISKKPISRLCFEGPMEQLTLTENLQPAIMAVNLACLAALNEFGFHADVSAGHSLGEYGALVSTGVVTTYDALRLVNKRGQLMHREALANPGTMVAALRMDISDVEQIIEQARGEYVLSVANHNTEQQIVITGENEAIERVSALIKERKGRAVPLKVSGAWHCDLMKGAVKEFRQFMDNVVFSKPKASILFNATAGIEHDPESIKDIMANQLVSPVKWYDIMKKMLNDGVTTFIEVGPKEVLAGLLEKIILPEQKANIINVQDVTSLEKLVSAC